MGYPMSWNRLIHRNQLLGDYTVESDGVELVWDPETKQRHRADGRQPIAVNGRLIAGDARRLEKDTVDEMHLAMYAKVAGVSKAKVAKLFEVFFAGSVIQEFQKFDPDGWHHFWRKHNPS